MTVVAGPRSGDGPRGGAAGWSETPGRDDSEQVEDAMDAIARAMDRGEPDPRPRSTTGGPAPDTVQDAPQNGGETGPMTDRSLIEQALERGLRAIEAEGDRRLLAIRASVSALVDQIYGAQDDGSPRADGASRHRARYALADLFLDGAAEAGAADPRAADPRLAHAREAQAIMERHIAHLFPGDAARIAAAARESRHRISGALRRGLDVSVRGTGARS